MAWDLSADREREQMESLRNAWLEREEVILNHFRVSAAMFRWGYRILGINKHASEKEHRSVIVNVDRQSICSLVYITMFMLRKIL